MERKTDLQYLKLRFFEKILYRIAFFICLIPRKLLRLLMKIGSKFKNLGISIKNECVDIWTTFIKGDWKTKLSFIIMGFGSVMRGQIVRGIIFFLFEAIFIIYLAIAGIRWLAKFPTLGTKLPGYEYNEVYDTEVFVEGDNSFKILLYSLLTIFFIIAFIYTWRLNVKQNKIAEEIIASGKKIKSAKDDLKSLVDNDFHKTLLALPLAGIAFFTLMPIVFMVLIAFTNYDGTHDGYNNLFTWIGFDNFNELLNIGDSAANANLSYTFGEILSWTLIWAIFATFTNYFLGMFVAMMINKKGIRFKKIWRGILVLTIAIPQFVSLLYVSKLFSYGGLVNSWLMNLGIIDTPIRFWAGKLSSRILVIVINIWIGIPYLMLIASGILMNIPNDLYESARVEGANSFQQFTKITMPYMLFVTGPYLLTSFIGNINNFNVIYLLTWGQSVDNPALTTSGGNATDTDLLITWLFKITTGATSNYKLSAVISIMIFIVVAVLSLVVFNIMPSTRNEEDYK